MELAIVSNASVLRRLALESFVFAFFPRVDCNAVIAIIYSPFRSPASTTADPKIQPGHIMPECVPIRWPIWRGWRTYR